MIKNWRKNDMLHTMAVVVGYGLCFQLLQLFLYKTCMVRELPSAETLLRYDSNVYQHVAENGYVYTHPKFNNTGVFILFPWLWRLLHVGVVGICIVNYLLFGAGFTVLARLYKIDTVEKLLWLSIPTVYIMMIPYSEALFFVLMAICLYGIEKGSRAIIWSTLFLASLTRATSIFLLPSLLVMEAVCGNRQPWHRILLSYVDLYVVPIIGGLLFFIWYQHHAIGIWFAYFIQQQKYEGHEFAIPILPFSSGEGFRMMWISALAILVGTFSIIGIVLKLKSRFRNQMPEPDKLLVLSMGFLGATLLKTIFYNPIWGTYTTLTIGINRYVFATPFFYVFLYYVFNPRKAFTPWHYLAVFALSNTVWLTCGSYVHIISFLFYNSLTGIVFLYMKNSDKKSAWPAMVLMAFNLCMQTFMFQQYLANLYLD
jgi:hypothetical protein